MNLLQVQDQSKATMTHNVVSSYLCSMERFFNARDWSWEAFCWLFSRLSVRESKTVLDSEFPAVDSGFQEMDSKSFSVKLGFRIPIVNGIPDSLSCIPDSKAQDTGFRIPDLNLH